MSIIIYIMYLFLELFAFIIFTNLIFLFYRRFCPLLPFVSSPPVLSFIFLPKLELIWNDVAVIFWNPIFSYYYGHRVYVDLNCRVVFFWNSFIILPKLELIWGDVAVIFWCIYLGRSDSWWIGYSLRIQTVLGMSLCLGASVFWHREPFRVGDVLVRPPGRVFVYASLETS